MANAIARLAERGMRRQESLLTHPVAGPLTFKYPVSGAAAADPRETTFPCVPSTLERGTQIEVGGNLVTIALVLLVRRNLFFTADSRWHSAADEEGWSAATPAPLPISGKLLEHEGVVYKIILVGASADQSHIKITLVDRNSGK